MRSDTHTRSPASLQKYQADLSSVSTLDRQVERDLTLQWRGGDKAAGRRLIEACLPFVISIALEYRRWGVPLEDIIQQGNLGLLKAASKFDLSKDCRLATYAAYWIRAEIREYVVRGFRVVRLGTTKSERRALRAYRTTGENDPTQLAKASGLTVERATMILPILSARETSLDAAVADQGPAVERMPSREPSPEEHTSTTQLRTKAKKAVARAMLGLSEREQMIVRERMMSDEPITLEELGATLGVSKERVRQIEVKAKGKLRESLSGFEELLAS